jgi:hypothetical protein
MNFSSCECVRADGGVAAPVSLIFLLLLSYSLAITQVSGS